MDRILQQIPDTYSRQIADPTPTIQPTQNIAIIAKEQGNYPNSGERLFSLLGRRI
jgi:hypothetical protein